jgi:predicted ATPase
MITLIEARNFRCLRYIRQPLGPLHVLVGPNASGKTTFLDSIAFLGRLVSDGLEAAVGDRSQDFRDLVWRRTEGNFELAVEAGIPAERRRLLADREFETVRYEVSVGPDPDTKETSILGEKVLLRKQQPPASSDGQRTLFPAPPEPPATILMPKMTKGAKTVVNKVPDGNDNFCDETGKGWDHAFKLGPRKSALASLPEDESKFPVSTWLKALLIDGVQQIVLNSLLIRRASPPGQVRSFKPDGSNLPWVIDNLERKSPDRLQQWIAHVQTALPDVEGIRTVERPEDRHRYLVLRYRGGLEVPSWVASDGTLRLLALTLLAYLPEFYGVYLIEEPENGIHPLAVESVFQSLSSAYDAQILVATHSPVMLSLAEADKILCFAKTPEGATDIVLGSDHPALRDWRGETNLADLFAAGVLGQ